MAEKVALVLGGGGTVGAVEVGFIDRLEELGVKVDFIVGTSVGALNAAHVAFHDGRAHSCLSEIWHGLREERVFRRRPWRALRQLWRTRTGLFENRLVGQLLLDHLIVDDFANARIPLHVTATNICTGGREVFSEGSIVEAVRASTAIPGLFPPVEINGQYYVDGAVSAGVDVKAAVELGATTVIAIDLRSAMVEECPANIIDVLTRSVEIISHARSHCNLEHADFDAKVVHIQPGLKTSDRWNFKDVDRLLRDSYTMACQVFDECWDGKRFKAGHYHLSAEEE
jgi:NTE family protein